MFSATLMVGTEVILMPTKWSYSDYDKLHRKSSQKLSLKLYVGAALFCFFIFLLYGIL